MLFKTLLLTTELSHSETLRDFQYLQLNTDSLAWPAFKTFPVWSQPVLQDVAYISQLPAFVGAAAASWMLLSLEILPVPWA